MLHQLIATICGITLHTQVNACRITLQQATVEYNAKLNRKAERIKVELEEQVRNQYTETLFVIGKVAYDRQINITHGRFNVLLRSDRTMCTIRWEF
jgi:hypothetical protein